MKSDEEFRNLDNWLNETLGGLLDKRDVEAAEQIDEELKSLRRPPQSPLLALWQRIEERLTGKLAEGLGAIEAKVASQEFLADPAALLGLLVDIEAVALDIAREEMRRDGMIPTMTAGRVLWFDTAKAISHYLRGRIGLPLDPSEPGGGA